MKKLTDSATYSSQGLVRKLEYTNRIKIVDLQQSYRDDEFLYVRKCREFARNKNHKLIDERYRCACRAKPR